MRAIPKFVCVAALLLPGLAAAQTSPATQTPSADQPPPADQAPPRIGNVWNNQSHEPDRSAVHQEEKQSGVLGTPAQQQTRRDEVETLDKDILQRAQQSHDGVMSGRAATAPTP